MIFMLKAHMDFFSNSRTNNSKQPHRVKLSIGILKQHVHFPPTPITEDVTSKAETTIKNA